MLAAADDMLAEKLAALDTDADGAVSAEEMTAGTAAKKAAILEKFDTDGDGAISAAELAAGLPKPPDGDGHDGHHHHGCHGLSTFDTDGDGAISDAELDAFLADRLAGLLEKVDTDGDGAISVAELAAFPDDCAEHLKALDTDGDGTVSAAELAASVAKKKAEILARFDTNGDGTISADELAFPKPRTDNADEDTGETEDTDTVTEKSVTFLASAAPVFVRGDATADGSVDLTDAISILGYLFLGQENPGCTKAADANDDGGVDVSDPLGILSALFQGYELGIAAPYPAKGIDPTSDIRRPRLRVLLKSMNE
jgi:Ca2+-binding EF-hand superfamily protein